MLTTNITPFSINRRSIDGMTKLHTFMARQFFRPSLVYEFPRSPSDIPHSVGLLCMNDRPLTDKTQHSHETDTYGPSWIRTRNASKREAVDPCLRPRGHWDQNITSHWTTQSKLINIGLYGYLLVLCTSSWHGWTSTFSCTKFCSLHFGVSSSKI
jgi:hypothetical protein